MNLLPPPPSVEGQPLDAGLTSLAGLTYVADAFVKMTGAETFSLRTIAQTKSDLSLNLVENTALSTWAGTTNITTLGTIATVGNITIADGGTIGQAAGPLLTFDDTNNYLEISGCEVGIGTTTPISTYKGLDISSGGLSLIIGADNLASTRTDATKKNARFGIAHYTNAEEPLGILLADSGTSWSYVFFGGGSGLVNAATELRFYTAANITTTTGTVRLTINNNDIKFENSLKIKEQAAADADTAAYGQIWVKTATPNTLWFTDDAGTDVQLGAGGGWSYTDRGDPAAHDYQVGNFNTDGTWRDKDLSAIIGTGVKLVHIKISLKGAVGNGFYMRENGNSNAFNFSGGVCLNTVDTHYLDCLVLCDANGVIEYLASSANLSRIDFLVRGWWS